MALMKPIVLFLLCIFSTLVAAALAESIHASPTYSLIGPPTASFSELARLDALATDAARTEIKGYVKNNCGFPIYVQYARCCTKPGRCAYPIHTIANGGDFWTEETAKNNQCSQTIRVYHDQTYRNVYQVEYSMDPAGDVWYNLSSVDGDPFNKYKRFLEIARQRQCPWMLCNPGDLPSGCDWPYHEGRCAAGDVKFYLC